jgi:hypothetical protein
MLTLHFSVKPIIRNLIVPELINVGEIEIAGSVGGLSNCAKYDHQLESTVVYVAVQSVRGIIDDTKSVNLHPPACYSTL